MPSYKGHLVGGCVAWGLLFVVLRNYNPSTATAFEWFLCTLAGALFPDIDIKSKGQKYFYYAILLLFIALILKKQYELFTCCSIIAVTPMLARHRGIFHQLWFILMAPCIVWLLLSMMWPQLSYLLFFDTFFFIAGAISHIWLDVGFRRMMR